MELIEADESQNFAVPSSGSITGDRMYYVTGSDDAEAVYDFLADELPRDYGSLRLADFNVRRLGPGLYQCNAQYGIGVPGSVARTNITPTPLESNTGEESYAFSFTTTGATYHTADAVSQTAFGVGAPDVGTTIADGDGVDITGPKLQFTIRKRKAGSLITLAYVNTLVSLTGKTNNAVFLGFAAGELLFLGADGQQVRGGDTEITFSFAASPNVASTTFAGVTVTDIKGHDYVWAKKEPTAAGGWTTKGVYRATLYQSGDFSLLGAT
jgi:hypothetical protein